MELINERIPIAAAVILYHPDSNVYANIQTYYHHVDRVYIYDNTEKPSQQASWLQHPKVKYYHDGRNRGLAERLNQAAEKAIADGFHWLLTMDQDSRFTEHTITHYLDCFSIFAAKEKVGLFGPVFYNEERQVPSDCRWQVAERVITSGSLMNLDAFQRIGGFDGALFIDSVDHDYCIKAKLSGFQVIEFLSVAMVHRLGSLVHRSSIKTLFLVKKKKEVHAPLRCYYMLRNYLYLSQKYKGHEVPLMRIIRRDVKDRIGKALFYGRNSKALIHYLLLAYSHFKQNKLGKLAD